MLALRFSLRVQQGLLVTTVLLLAFGSVATAGDVWQQTRMKPFEDECISAPNGAAPLAGVNYSDREDCTTAGVAQVMPPVRRASRTSATVVPPVHYIPSAPPVATQVGAKDCADQRRELAH